MVTLIGVTLFALVVVKGIQVVFKNAGSRNV